MAFKQYTHCIKYESWKKYWSTKIGGQTPVIPLVVSGILEGLKYAILGAILGALGGAAFGGVGVAAGAATGASIGFSFGLIEGFADQWLNRRLICVQRDVCATGRVAWIESVEKKQWTERIFDNDLSFNLRLTPYSGQEFPRKDFTPNHNHGWQDIRDDKFPATELIRRHLTEIDYRGYEPGEYPDHPGGRWTLHCELEGNAMETLRILGKILSFAAPVLIPVGVVAGAVAGAIMGAQEGYERARDACKKACKIPVFCDIVCTIAGLAAAVALGWVGAVAGALVGAVPGVGALVAATLIGDLVNTDGSFADAANDPASGTIEEEDALFVAGDLVYDAGHKEGWHEIHPVKHLQKICSRPHPGAVLVDEHGESYGEAECPPERRTNHPHFQDQNFRDRVTLFWDRWCKQYQTSRDPLVIDNQQNPENQWCLHPLIDGCGRQPEEDRPSQPVDPGGPIIR